MDLLPNLYVYTVGMALYLQWPNRSLTLLQGHYDLAFLILSFFFPSFFSVKVSVLSILRLMKVLRSSLQSEIIN